MENELLIIELKKILIAIEKPSLVDAEILIKQLIKNLEG